jgi:hypothetical protein
MGFAMAGSNKEGYNGIVWANIMGNGPSAQLRITPYSAKIFDLGLGGTFFWTLQVGTSVGQLLSFDPVINLGIDHLSGD